MPTLYVDLICVMYGLNRKYPNSQSKLPLTRGSQLYFPFNHLGGYASNFFYYIFGSMSLITICNKGVTGMKKK